MTDDSQKQGPLAVPRGVAAVGLPALERKPLLVWLIRGLFLLESFKTGAWLVNRALVHDTSQPGKIGIALASFGVGIVLLVALQRRARWSHAVSSFCLATIAALGCMQNLRGALSERMLGMYLRAPGDDVPLVPALLWLTLAVWLAIDPRTRRYLAATSTNAPPA